MSWKSILTSTVSVAAVCAVAGSVEWKPPEVRYVQPLARTNDWAAAGVPTHTLWFDAFNAETGRVRNVRQFLPHSCDAGFFIRHLQRQYSNDMQTVQGRIRWHGRPVYQGIDDTNRMCKVERFADGTIHVEPFRKVDFASRTNSAAWKANAARRKAALEKRRAEIAAKKNVLPGLKEAQLKTFDNKNTESNVTVNVNIGGGNGR